ncbi:MAG: HD-GYP domain-containing protein [Spirochaetales bacterium]|nr:HD-GYP domain-containing protein [Spirochaetales bacterium]
MNTQTRELKNLLGLKAIQVNDLYPGMMFDAPVYIDERNLLLLEELPLKEKEIQRLTFWDIKTVYTEGNIIDKKSDRYILTGNTGYDENKEENKYKDYYFSAINRFEEILNDIKGNIKVIPERIDAIVRDIISLLENNKNLLLQLVLPSNKQKRTLAVNSVNCCIISLVIGLELKFLKYQLFSLGITALLHDIGMIRVPEKICLKKGALTGEEIRIIRHHLIYSYIIILNELEYHKDIAEYALFHHENWDGSGYSRKLAGEKIPFISRIISVTDSYVTMINERPYKPRMSGYMAMKTIISNNGKKFDPVVIKALLNSIGVYPIGSIVQLNSYLVGKVIEYSPGNGFRPKIQFLKGYSGKGIKKYDIIDLSITKDLFIKNIIE